MSGRARWLWLALAIACGCAPEAERYVAESAADSAAADRAIAGGQAEEALARLLGIAEREVPGSVAAEDARVIRQDALDRAARLLLEGGDLDGARRMVDRGLALGEGADVFTANLLTTRGRIHEARGEDREAARDYHRALAIQERLLDRALGGEGE